MSSAAPSRRRRFVHNVGMLVGSGLAAQAIGMLFQPVITRLYSPADYGHLAQFTFVSAVLLAIGAFCFDLSIPRAESERKARALLALALMVIGGWTVALFGGLAALEPVIRHVPVLNRLAPLHWFLPAALLCMGAQQAFTHFATRHQQFRQVSLARIWQTLFGSGTQIALGLAGAGAAGLIAGSVGAALAAAIALALLLGVFRALRPPELHRPDIAAAATETRRFAFWATANALVNALGLNIHLLLMSHFYGLAPAGHLMLAMKPLYVLNLLGLPVAQVFYGELSERRRGAGGGKLFPVVLRTTAVLAGIGLLVAAVLATGARPIFRLYFGAAWDEAGRYAALLSFYVMSTFVGSPISMTLVSLGRMRLAAAWSIFRLLLVAGGFFACAAAGAGAPTAVAVFSVTAGLAQWLMVGLCFAAARRATPRS